MGTSRSGRIAVAAATAVVIAAVAPPAHGVETAGSLRASTSSTTSGAGVTFAGRLPTKVKRGVALQLRTSSGWRLLETDRTSRRGRFDLAVPAPAQARTHTFRVTAKRVVKNGQVYKAIKTPTVKVAVVAPASAAAPAPVPGPAPAPAPPPQASPPAPPAPGSRESPLTIGTPFTTGRWGFTVGATDLDAAPEVLAHNPLNDPPLPDWSFVMVPVSFTFVGTGTGFPFEADVQFVGGSGVVYDAFDFATDQSCGDYPSNWLFLNELLPGATVSGNVCVPVPTLDVAGGLWRLSDGINDDVRFVRLG